MEKVVASKYKLIRKIGAGSFGQIYIGEDISTHKQVAVKLESTKNQSPQLPYESKLYNVFSGCCSVPKLYFYGSEGHYNVMAIDLLGKSLEDHLVEKRHRLSLKTVLMLTDQMISCVEFVHSKNYIHRDIKPDNFVMGTGKNSNKVYIIDFGLSKRYRDQFTHQHIPWIEGKSLTGTARYASVNALRGIEQSRRDDMEALGYVWLYLLRGSLPWMGLKGKDQKHKYDRICEVKARTKVEDLCKGFPDEFVQYFKEIKKLHFTDTPNYALYRQMFRSLFVRLGYVYDGVFDWTDPQQAQQQQQQRRSQQMTNISEHRNLPIVNIGMANQKPQQQNQQKDQMPANHFFQYQPIQQPHKTFEVSPAKEHVAAPNQLANNNPDTARRYFKRENEVEGNVRNDQNQIKKTEPRKLFAQEPTAHQILRADPIRKKENIINAPINDHQLSPRPNKNLYGPPRLIKHSQLPRWMADVGYTVTRLKI